MTENWNFIKTITDSEPFFINGINIWDFEWEYTDERIDVRDSLHNQNYIFRIYKIITNNLEIEFAAGEFSNCVWGIYQKV